MKVLKFGGTSVGSAAALRQVKEIISQATEPIVVCSALSGVTNLLEKMAREAAQHQDYMPLYESLEQKHLDVITELIKPTSRNSCLLEIKILLNQLQQKLQGVALLGELTDRTMAEIMSYGEQLSCTLITSYLNTEDIHAQYVDARKMLKTDSQYLSAKVLDSNEQIVQYLSQVNGIPIVTGFIASNEQGHTTTLGRGGSDYTASILGAALKVAEIQIWTDVDGFYTADPRLVSKAFPLKEISYSEALELSYFGAKVIYAPTLIPAINAKIPIAIKNTFNPQAHGTLIQDQETEGNEIKGISSITDIALINIEGNGMVGFKGFSARLFTALSQKNINIILITQASSEHTITLAVLPSDAQPAIQAITQEFEYEIFLKTIQEPTALYNKSIIAIVGSNMRRQSGASAKVFQALGKSGVNISAVAQGSSERNISIVINSSDLHKSLNAIHDALFASTYKTIHAYMVGVGSVGSELIQQIQLANERLLKVHHQYISIEGISNSTKMLFQSDLQNANWKELLEQNGESANIEEFILRIAEQNLSNSIFIDNTANAGIAQSYQNVLENKIAVVTSNKIACSSPLSIYQKLKKLSTGKSVPFLYETNVGAGLPIIKTLQDLVISGDEILKVEAILSGTISYIFNQYKGDRDFTEIVKQAQALGYTEPDPRDDLNGLDFKRKVLILAREIGLDLELEDINLVSLLPAACFDAPSVEEFYQALPSQVGELEKLKQQAEQEQKVVRYIATIENNQAKVELKLVDASHPFYGLSGSDNIISFTTARYKNNPLVVKGPGAGVGVTAAGVFADILKAAQ